MSKKIFQICVTDPEYAKVYEHHSTYHEGDSGLDIFMVSDVEILPGETKLVGLGIKCQLMSQHQFLPWKKQYYSYMMFPRSSISKTPLRLANSIGLCDSGYTGELKAPLHNTSNKPFTIKRGERYVQLVAPNLDPIKFELVKELRNTDRNTGGFGSTGK